MRKKLSVTIITLNEEENIKRCIDSIKEIADEIIVVDSGSKDNTLEIVKELGAETYLREFSNYADQKNFAAEKASGEWIYSIDADERNTRELNNEIHTAISSSDLGGYLIPRRNIIFGKEIKHTRWSPDKHIWLWKKDKGKWKGEIHEEVEVQGEVGELENAKIHYQYETVSDFMNMINNYTELEAEKKIKEGQSFSMFRMIFDAKLSFFRRFIYKRGLLDGWRGFVLSYLMAIYRLTTWVKVWEKQ